METNINKETGLADPPIHPCHKGEGLCKVRLYDDKDFMCAYEAKSCRYRVVKKAPPNNPLKKNRIIE